MPFWKTATVNRRKSTGNVPPLSSYDDYEIPDSPLFYSTGTTNALNRTTTVVTSPNGERRTRLDARQSLRTELFGSSAEELGLGRTYGEYSPNSTPNKVPSPTKHKAPVWPATAGVSVEVESAIALLQQLKRTATSDDIKALRTTLDELEKEEDEGQNSVNTHKPQTQLKHDKSVMRSRSIVNAPGVATRQQSPNVPQQPQSQSTPTRKDSAEEQYQREDLEKLSALDEFMKDPKTILTTGSVVRAGTPADNAAYSNLGVFGLGTLRITNGIASPAPSIFSANLTSKPSASLSGREEDYYTASEGGDPIPHSMADPAFRSRSPSLNSLFENTPLRSQNEQSRIVIPTFTLNNSDKISPLTETNSPADPHNPGFEHQNTTHLQNNARVPPFDFAAGNDRYNVLWASHEDTNHMTPRSTQISLPPRLPQKSIVSGMKQDPDDDDSVYSEHIMHGQSIATQTARLDPPLRSIDMPSSYRPVPKRNPSLSSSLYTNDAVVRRSLNEPRTIPYDSGYSSEASVKVLTPLSDTNKQDPFTLREPTLPKLDQEPPCEHQAQENNAPLAGGSNYTNQASAISLEQRKAIRSIIQEKFQPTVEVQNVSSQEPSLNSTPIKKETHDTNNSDTPRSAKKLQKKRPFSGRSLSTPIIIQRVQPMESLNSVPHVPLEIATKHRERISRSPGMDHLEQTYSSVSDSDPRRRSRSPEKRFEPVDYKFPSPTRSPETPRGRKSWTLGSSQSTAPKRLFRSKSRSKSRKTSERKTSAGHGSDDGDGDVPNGVADFGSVAQSLGSSPYDIATSRTKSERSAPRPGELIHPHQITSAFGHSRPIVGMTAKTASQFAMHKSRDRRDDFDLSSTRPKTRELTKNEASNLKRDRSRPRSYQPDAPPIPMPVPPLKLPRPKSFQGSAPSMNEARQFWSQNDQNNHDSTVNEDLDRARSRGPPQREAPAIPPRSPSRPRHKSVEILFPTHPDNVYEKTSPIENMHDSSRPARDTYERAPDDCRPQDSKMPARVREPRMFEQSEQSCETESDPSSNKHENSRNYNDGWKSTTTSRQPPSERLPQDDPGNSTTNSEWETSAKLWRQRRKSIGENLRPTSDLLASASIASTNSTPESYPVRTQNLTPRSEPRQQQRNHWQTSSPERPLPYHNRHPQPPPRNASPTPSVLERAARFECAEAMNPSPRALSPDKTSAPIVPVHSLRTHNQLPQLHTQMQSHHQGPRPTNLNETSPRPPTHRNTSPIIPGKWQGHRYYGQNVSSDNMIRPSIMKRKSVPAQGLSGVSAFLRSVS